MTALVGADGRGSDVPLVPLRAAQGSAGEDLVRRPEEKRVTHVGEGLGARDQSERLVPGLSEVEAGVDDDPLAWQAGIDSHGGHGARAGVLSNLA
jgi:hypothetical protein